MVLNSSPPNSLEGVWDLSQNWHKVKISSRDSCKRHRLEGTQHLSPFQKRLGRTNSGWTQGTPSSLPTSCHRVGNEGKTASLNQRPIIFRSVFHAQSAERIPHLSLWATLLGHWGMPPRKQSILTQCNPFLAPQTFQVASHQGRGHSIKDA